MRIDGQNDAIFLLLAGCQIALEPEPSANARTSARVRARAKTSANAVQTMQLRCPPRVRATHLISLRWRLN